MTLEEKGFSLVEILLVAAISSIIGVLLVQVWVQNNSLFYQQTTKVTQGVSINDATTYIENDIKGASQVANGGPESTSPFTYTTSANTLVLKLPSIDAQGGVIANTFDFIVIKADGANPKLLKRLVIHTDPSVRPDRDQVLLNNLSSLSFSYQDSAGNSVSPSSATKINFTVDVSTTIGANTEQRSASREVNLRND